jgi:hypothetical protein
MKTFWRALVFRMRGHHATLSLIFSIEEGSLRWKKVSAMLIACGAEITPGIGDGTAIRLRNRVIEIHTRQDVVNYATVLKLRRYLELGGITPAEIEGFLAQEGLLP